MLTPRPSAATSGRRSALALAGAGAALAALSIAVLLAADAAGAHVPRFTRDPAAVDGRFGTGTVSLLGSLAWAVSATALGLAGALRRAQDAAPTPASRLLLGSAAFTALLCIDDTFAGHEHAQELGDGAELAVGLLFAAVAICWLAWARPLSDHHHRWVLAVAGTLLAASLTIDTLDDGAGVDVAGGGTAVLEDALKAGGVAAYTLWALSVAWFAVRPAPVATEVVDRAAGPGRNRQPEAAEATLSTR